MIPSKVLHRPPNPPPPHLLVSTLAMRRFQIDAIFKDSSLETVSKIVHSNQLYYKYFVDMRKEDKKRKPRCFKKAFGVDGA